jgi:hypothetical protein
MSQAIPLSKMKPGHNGRLKQAEVLGFDPDINGEPGMYLQFVEGCGYDVYEFTPDEARRLATELTAEADRQDAQVHPRRGTGVGSNRQ